MYLGAPVLGAHELTSISLLGLLARVKCSMEALQRAQWLRACLQLRARRFDPWVGKIPWSREWQPIPAILPRKFRGQRSLVGHRPQGHRESDIAEKLGTQTGSSCAWISVSFFRFGKLSAIISSNIILTHFFFSLSEIPLVCRLACFVVSHRSHILLYYYYFLLSVYCSDWVISIVLSSRSLICSLALFSLLIIALSTAFILANEFQVFLAPL